MTWGLSVSKTRDSSLTATVHRTMNVPYLNIYLTAWRQHTTRHRVSTSMLCYVAIATQPVHRLQIRPIVHNWEALPTIPPSYIRVRAYSSVGMWRETDRQTHIQTHRNRQTHRCASPIYISRRLRLTRNVIRGKRGITKRCC